MFRALLLAIAAAIALAGCVTPDAAEPPAPEGATMQAPAELPPIAFHVTGAGPAQNSQPNGGDVEIPANTTAVLVEARWTCPTPTCELTLAMRDPGGETKGTATGSGSARLVVEAPSTGTWNAAVFVGTAPTDATGEIRATLYTNGTPEPDDSAFDDAG